MANTAFAARPQAAAPVSRAEPVSARSRSASSAQVADFTKNLQADRSTSVNSALALNANQQQDTPAGGGLLSTGVQLLLAETRTQEAGAPLPPVSNFTRARDQYLSTQAQVRDTIAANQVLQQSREAAQAPSNGGAATSTAAVSGEPGLLPDDTPLAGPLGTYGPRAV